jgi:hypothetical protein
MRFHHYIHFVQRHVNADVYLLLQEFLGIHSDFWGFPDLLHCRPSRAVICHFMDRECANLLTLHTRTSLRTGHGRRILPSRLRGRARLATPWRLHD